MAKGPSRKNSKTNLKGDSKSNLRKSKSQTPPPFFEDVKVLGTRTNEEIKEMLQAMGESTQTDSPATKTRGGTRGVLDIFGLGQPKAWQHTAHQLGFIAPSEPGNSSPLPIVHPAVIAADPNLKNARINVHLDRLNVFDYPGGGEHLVMVTVKALNQIGTGAEPVSFTCSYRVRSGQSAGVIGYPLCLGLSVGKVGAAFQFLTINVKDSSDEAAVAVLESQSFTEGLNLLTIAQPALKPLTSLTLGLAKQFAARNRNCPVQDCYLGLDFAPTAFGARLAIGNYLAVQVPKEGTIKWEEWEFLPGDGLLLSKKNQSPLPYNYLVFRVSKFEET